MSNCVQIQIGSEYLWYTLLIQLEINKNLKFKKGVGIAIKGKETSSKLAI